MGEEEGRPDLGDREKAEEADVETLWVGRRMVGQGMEVGRGTVGQGVEAGRETVGQGVEAGRETVGQGLEAGRGRAEAGMGFHHIQMAL